MLKKILVLCAVAGSTLCAGVSDAAAIRFRGSISGIIGSDDLGLGSLPSPLFEAEINNVGDLAAISSGYIVFEGVYYNFASGTIVPNAPGFAPEFTGALVHPTTAAPSGTLTFNFPAGPGNLGGLDQPAFDLFTNLPGAGGNDSGLSVPGSFSLSFGGGTYLGSVTAVPEPASAFLLTAATVGFVGYRSRRKRAAASAATV